jgi:hypothetical protein
MQTPHRFRTKRQLWTYSGLGLETHDSAQYRVVEGQLRRSKKPVTLRGLNDNHNHDLKDIFKGAAMRASTAAGPLRDFYEALLAPTVTAALFIPSAVILCARILSLSGEMI